MFGTGNEAVLRVDGLRFMRGKRVILSDLAWEVRKGEIAAVVGPNGCGKSTLLRLIAGYLWPMAGSVTLLGEKLGETSLEDLRRRVGILEATTVYPFDEGMTALEVVVSGYFSSLSVAYLRPSRKQWQHAREALEQVSLGQHGDQIYATLSTGERMRCLIARALVRKPELVLLDEPTAGLDLPARETVLATMLRLHQTKGGPGIVVVTHHLEEILPGTRNVLLMGADGRVVASGEPGKVLTDANMTAAFRWPIEVVRSHGRWHAHVNPQSWAGLVGNGKKGKS